METNLNSILNSSSWYHSASTRSNKHWKLQLPLFIVSDISDDDIRGCHCDWTLPLPAEMDTVKS